MDILDVGIKIAETVVIIDVVVWGVNDVLLLFSGIFVVEFVASGNAVVLALVVIVAEASADVKLGFVGVVGVAAGELTDVVFIALIDTVLFNAEFVVDAESAEIVEVADEVLSLIVVFDNDCGVVEYMELMDVRFVDVEDEEIVDVGSVVITIDAVSDKGFGVVEYMKLIGVGVVNAKDVGVVILDDVGPVEYIVVEDLVPVVLGDIIEDPIVFVETGAVDSTDVAPDNVALDGAVAAVLADLETVASIYVVLMNVGLVVE